MSAELKEPAVIVALRVDDALETEVAEAARTEMSRQVHEPVAPSRLKNTLPVSEILLLSAPSSSLALSTYESKVFISEGLR